MLGSTNTILGPIGTSQYGTVIGPALDPRLPEDLSYPGERVGAIERREQVAFSMRHARDLKVSRPILFHYEGHAEDTYVLDVFGAEASDTVAFL